MRSHCVVYLYVFENVQHLNCVRVAQANIYKYVYMAPIMHEWMWKLV